MYQLVAMLYVCVLNMHVKRKKDQDKDGLLASNKTSAE